MTAVQEYLEYLVKGIVDDPNGVSTDQISDDMGVLITLKVNPKDVGLVIGRNGNMASALRSIIRTYGMKKKAHVSIKIWQPDIVKEGEDF